MKILISLILGINIYALQAQQAYSDAIRIRNFIQFTPKSTPARDSIELMDTLFNIGKMVSETYSPGLKDSILAILSKYYSADSLESVLDSNSILYNPYLSHLGPYLFTYTKSTWPILNKVVTRKHINTRGGYQFNVEDLGLDFSSFKLNGAEYSKLVNGAWFNFLSQSANPQIILAYLKLVQSISTNQGHEKYIRTLMPQIKMYVDQHKDYSEWSIDMLNIKNEIQRDLAHLKNNLNSSNRLPPVFISPDEVNHSFNLLQKDIHDLIKSYGMNDLNLVVLNGLDQGREYFKLQRMLSLGVLTLSLTDLSSGHILENINELKNAEFHKIYLGLIYASLYKLMTDNDGM